MSKRPRIEITEYCSAVEKKEQDGIYDDADLCKKYFAEVWMKEAQERESFTINSLLFEGTATGYAKCSSDRCREHMWITKKKATFKIQKGVNGGSAPGLMERHIQNYHSEKTARRDISVQPSIRAFAAKTKKLSDSTVRELRAANCNIIAQTHTSLNHFSKEAVRNRDRILLRAGGFDPDEVKRFDVTGPTCKRDLEAQSERHFDFLTNVIPKLAEKNLIALAVDHKAILNLKNQKLIPRELSAKSAEDNRPHEDIIEIQQSQNESANEDRVRPKDALGLQLILLASDGKRYSYLLEFQPVTEKTKDATDFILKKMLKNWNLQDSVDKGRIVFVMDGGNRGLAEKINPNGFTETCNFHSLQCVPKRGSNELLEKFDPQFKRKKADLEKFLQNVNDISKEEYKKLPRGSARGINSYLDNIKLTNEDRLRICSIMRPNGWKSDFENPQAVLSASDEKLKNKLLASKTKMPTIKVSLMSASRAQAILKRSSIFL